MKNESKIIKNYWGNTTLHHKISLLSSVIRNDTLSSIDPSIIYDAFVDIDEHFKVMLDHSDHTDEFKSLFPAFFDLSYRFDNLDEFSGSDLMACADDIERIHAMHCDMTAKTVIESLSGVSDLDRIINSTSFFGAMIQMSADQDTPDQSLFYNSVLRRIPASGYISNNLLVDEASPGYVGGDANFTLAYANSYSSQLSELNHLSYLAARLASAPVEIEVGDYFDARGIARAILESRNTYDLKFENLENFAYGDTVSLMAILKDLELYHQVALAFPDQETSPQFKITGFNSPAESQLIAYYVTSMFKADSIPSGEDKVLISFNEGTPHINGEPFMTTELENNSPSLAM